MSRVCHLLCTFLRQFDYTNLFLALDKDLQLTDSSKGVSFERYSCFVKVSATSAILYSIYYCESHALCTAHIRKLPILYSACSNDTWHMRFLNPQFCAIVLSCVVDLQQLVSVPLWQSATGLSQLWTASTSKKGSACTVSSQPLIFLN